MVFIRDWGVKMDIGNYYGNWQPSHVGPRAELDETYYIQLWRGGEVLKTKYKTKEQDGKLYLLLEENGLRYMPGGEPYATIKECFFEDDALTVIENFPISGDSTDRYLRTDQNRYGNVDIVDEEFLPKLQGYWSNGRSFLKIDGNMIYQGYSKDACDDEAPFTVVKSRYDSEIRITHKNPTVEGVLHYIRVVFKDNKLYATVMVCDGPSIEEIFERA